MQALLHWKKQYYIFWVCACSLSYPTCNAHVRITLLSVVCLHLPCFPTLFHKRYDFRGKKGLLKTQSVFWIFLKIPSEISLILNRIQRDMVINAKGSSPEVPIILLRFQSNLKFLGTFSKIKKNTQTSNFMKIRPVWDEMFHTDRRTDITKLTVAFLKFANAPKKWLHWPNSGYYNVTVFKESSCKCCWGSP